MSTPHKLEIDHSPVRCKVVWEGKWPPPFYRPNKGLVVGVGNSSAFFHSSPASQQPKTPQERQPNYPNKKGHTMTRLLGLIGAAIGSTIGWWLGARIGIMTAFLISTLGTGFGLYYGTRLARHWLP